ncbi:MAG: monovalent cation/H+ antiporter complex subunit F [Thermodesulfobacteriota bacterium]
MYFIALLILITLLASLGRMVLGPTRADKLMVTQLFSTCGSAVLLVLSRAMEMDALVDVAILLVLLGAVAMVAFTLADRQDRR